MIRVYTDGASSGNSSGPGGWGVVAYTDADLYEPDTTVIHEAYGWSPKTTNSEMELMAVAKAISWVRDFDDEVVVYSDSAYVVNCMRRRWYENWRKNGWRTYRGSPVAHVVLWEQIILCTELIRGSGNPLDFRKVKGHSNSSGNIRADELAVAAKKSRIDSGFELAGSAGSEG